jgi:hypothetical protein
MWIPQKNESDICSANMMSMRATLLWEQHLKSVKSTLTKLTTVTKFITQKSCLFILSFNLNERK